MFFSVSSQVFSETASSILILTSVSCPSSEILIQWLEVFRFKNVNMKMIENILFLSCSELCYMFTVWLPNFNWSMVTRGERLRQDTTTDQSQEWGAIMRQSCDSVTSSTPPPSPHHLGLFSDLISDNQGDFHMDLTDNSTSGSDCLSFD